ncbi:MAG: hypothetical protein AB1796_12575 [Bacillota bacterium]
MLKGDQKAYQPLVTRYSSLVYSTALRIVGSPAAAEDVSQKLTVNFSGARIERALCHVAHFTPCQVRKDAAAAEQGKNCKDGLYTGEKERIVYRGYLCLAEV